MKLKGLKEYKISLDNLANKARDESKVIIKKQVTQMFNRASKNSKKSPGGTPIDTGELRLSRKTSDKQFGYTADYAPHVEFGHRTRGGYVKGQKFLKKNFDIQVERFKKDIEKVFGE